MAPYKRYIKRYVDKSTLKTGSIVLVLFSEIDHGLLEALKNGLENTFKRPVEIRGKAQSLRFAYVSERDQYLSPALLSKLRHMKKCLSDIFLGVVDVDLYSPGYEFVYGEADVGCGVATVSISRLQGGPGENTTEKTAERVIKEAVHELGHLYGLGHCPDPKCVMRFSTKTKDIDTKRPNFCQKCSQVF